MMGIEERECLITVIGRVMFVAMSASVTRLTKGRVSGEMLVGVIVRGGRRLAGRDGDGGRGRWGDRMGDDETEGFLVKRGGGWLKEPKGGVQGVQVCFVMIVEKEIEQPDEVKRGDRRV